MYISYSVVVSDSLQPHGLSMEFSRQEYWSRLPFPSPGDLPNPGTKAGSPSLQADYLFSELQGKPILKILANYMKDTVEREMQCFKEASFSFDRHLKVKVAQSRPTLCDPMDYTVHGFLQARILEWVAFPFSRKYLQSRDRTQVSRIADSLQLSDQGVCVQRAKLLQSCPTLCDPMNCSPPDSSVHGILQASIPGWAAMPSSRGSFQPRDGTCVSWESCTAGGFLTAEPPGKPI